MLDNENGPASGLNLGLGRLGKAVRFHSQSRLEVAAPKNLDRIVVILDQPNLDQSLGFTSLPASKLLRSSTLTTLYSTRLILRKPRLKARRRTNGS